MANIREIISGVEKFDPELARQLRKFVKDHSYGLVFEENLPDAIRLYTKRPGVDDIVNILPDRGQREKKENTVPWVVRTIRGDQAVIEHAGEGREIPLADLVTLVSYRDVIYPGLKEVDRIERGDPTDPYHVVINAENYHALEALLYCYPGKVDCIYIDPPYNSGAKDWKYNNSYVDSSDQYRHSKWLEFMRRRLELARQLLNPQESVLIVTIDEKEYLRLGLLLEQVFSGERIQMISSVINPAGVARQGEFARTDEYLFVVFLGTASPQKVALGDEWLGGVATSCKNTLHWNALMRTGTNGLRSDRPNLFYPIYVSEDGTRIVKIGESLPLGESREQVEQLPGCRTIWPIRTNGTEGNWQISQQALSSAAEKGFVRLGSFTPRGMAISYLKSGEQKKVEQGLFPVIGHRPDGSIVVDDSEYEAKYVPGTQWRIASHDASRHGSGLLQRILPGHNFAFPKSLYAVEDTLRFFVANKPEALIVDFFAGSGTTLHAVNLLNAKDGGHRRCICVTNNEVSAEEARKFTAAGLRQGDPAWEQYGIARYVTWPRTRCCIEGVDSNGQPLRGTYLGSDLEMADGFRTNAIFCELTYESAWPIRLDCAFNAIAPLLWMQAGCRGPIIRRIGKSYLTTDYYGVLFDYGQASKFCEKVKNTPSIKVVYVVTDDQRRYSNMCKRLPNISVHRLYETYLRTFEICGEGGRD